MQSAFTWRWHVLNLLFLTMVNVIYGHMLTPGAMRGRQFVQTRLLFELRHDSGGGIAWYRWKNLLQQRGFERNYR